jgi:hypothetical protein
LTTHRPAGPTTRTPSCAGSASTPKTSPPTRGPGDGAPSRPINSPSRWTTDWTRWAVSFIVTNIPYYQPADAVAVEAWVRRRTDIEDRIRDAKLGAALRHLPSGHAAVNRVWMWAALLACNLSVLLQAFTGLDTAGRAHGERLRRELLHIPARVIRHARRLELRLPPGPQILPEVLARLRALPTAA